MIWEAVVSLMCPRLEVTQLQLDGEQAGRPRMSDWDVLAVSAGLARCSTLKVGGNTGQEVGVKVK